MAFVKDVVSYPQLGGMRTDIPLTSFGPTDAVTARNVRMTTSGRVSRRQGGAKYNVTQLPSADHVLVGG